MSYPAVLLQLTAEVRNSGENTNHMIAKALKFTVSALNQFIERRMDVESGFVVMNKLINADGSQIDINRNKLVISLINLEKETARPFYNTGQRQSHSYADRNPSIRLNADVLVTANFDDYEESISFLNATIGFFQAHTMLDSKYSAFFPPELVRLEFELEKTTYQQMQNLWTSIGAKYQPSVVYKIRLLTVQGNEVSGFTPLITQTGNVAAE